MVRYNLDYVESTVKIKPNNSVDLLCSTQAIPQRYQQVLTDGPAQAVLKAVVKLRCACDVVK